MPKWAQSRILRMMDYGYINFDVTLNNALLMLQKSGFKLEKTVKVYHLGIMKLLPTAPAYFFIARKMRKNRWRAADMQYMKATTLVCPRTGRRGRSN
jgi:hypothetical protein